MKIATFTDEKSTRIGIVSGGHILDLSRAAPSLPTEMRAFLERGKPAMDGARAAAALHTADIPMHEVRLEAPVTRPRKFLALALNYFLRAPLNGMDTVEFESIQAQQNAVKAENRQSWYNKQVTCINGPTSPIQYPHDAKELYYEAELAFVIGNQCRHVSQEDSKEFIAGFLICNDVTEGAWCRGSPTLSLGKSFDSFGPLGPWLVTPDEIGDPHQLEISGYVNGKKRQSGNTRDLIFNCYELIAFASRRFTLEPGDVVTTGMPYCRLEPLQPGDLIRCEIERIGYIENRLAYERHQAQKP